MCDGNFFASLKARITHDPTRSTRKLSNDFKVANTTVRLAVKDLVLKSYKMKVRLLLTTTRKANRVMIAKKLLTWPCSCLLYTSDAADE